MVLLYGEKPISNKLQNQAKHYLQNWRQWQAPFQTQPQIIKQLEGGLTNTNYLVEAGSYRAVLRLNNPDAYQLGVNRQAEIAILKKLQSTNIVPRFYYADSEILVSEFIDGSTLDADRALQPEIKKHIEQALHEVQAIELADVKTRNYQSYLSNYCSHINPCFMDESLSQAICQIASTIDAQDWKPVLCHHDLIPENIITSSRGIFIIDWEYAAMGHPQFDYLRIFSNEKTTSKLPTFQAILDQLWCAIRYPQRQQTLRQKLINIVEAG